MLQHIRAVPWTAMLDIGSFLHSYLLPLRSLFIWAKSDTSGAHWSTADAVNRCPPTPLRPPLVALEHLYTPALTALSTAALLLLLLLSNSTSPNR